MAGDRARPRRLAATALVMICAGGCAPATPATHFYVLSAVRGPAVAGGPAGPGVTVGLGPVVLPGYLDRPQIVTRGGGEEIDLAEFDQWAEPLRTAVPRALAEDLGARIPNGQVVLFPWRGVRTVHYQVAIEVYQFEGTLAGDVILRARWRLLDGSGRELASRTTARSEPTGGPGYAPLVAALTRALAAMSEEIAAAIAASPR